MADIIKPSEYKVLVANGSSDLSNLVTDALEDGWELEGNLIMTSTYLNDSIKYKFAQVVVKYKD